MIKKLSEEEADKWKDKHLTLGSICTMEDTKYTLIRIMQVIIHILIFICIKEVIGSILICIIEAIIHIAMGSTVVIDLKKWEKDWDNIFADSHFVIDVKIIVKGTGMLLGEKVKEE